MVFFQCETCISTLKKKQVEPHYLTQCRNADTFTCLSCNKQFNRETIKAHTTCISEAEKYQKGDNMVKKKAPINNAPKPIMSVNISELKWSGFKKTSKIILMSKENYKMKMNELVNDLASVYARTKNEEQDNVDMNLLKKYLLEKLEQNDHFVIDLGKEMIRYKP